MSEPMGNAIHLQERVSQAAEGEMSEDEQAFLAEEVVGAFESVPVIGRAIAKYARARNWIAACGSIGTYIDMSRVKAQTTSISNNAVSTSSASVGVEISMLLDVQRQVGNADDLTREQKDELSSLLRDAVEAAQANRPRKVGERLRDWLEIGANSVAVAQAIGPLLLQLGQMLTSQPPVA